MGPEGRNGEWDCVSDALLFVVGWRVRVVYAMLVFAVVLVLSFSFRQ